MCSRCDWADETVPCSATWGSLHGALLSCTGTWILKDTLCNVSCQIMLGFSFSVSVRCKSGSQVKSVNMPPSYEKTAAWHWLTALYISFHFKAVMTLVCHMDYFRHTSRHQHSLTQIHTFKHTHTHTVTCTCTHSIKKTKTNCCADCASRPGHDVPHLSRFPGDFTQQ